MRFVIATTTVLVLVLGGVASAESVDPIKMQVQGGRYVLYTVPFPLFVPPDVKAEEATAAAGALVALNKENTLSVLVDSETGSAWLLRWVLGTRGLADPGRLLFEPIVFTTLEKPQRPPGQPLTPRR